MKSCVLEIFSYFLLGLRRNDMKGETGKILIMLLIAFILPGCSVFEARIEEGRIKREQKIKEGYEAVRKMAFSGLYRFTATHVYPSGGYPARDIGGNRYYLSVDVYDVQAFLPFFGEQYMAARPGESGISIDGKLENLMIEESDSRHRVLIRFSVEEESDNYQVTLDIGPSGDANLTISSTKRSTISYVGKVNPLDIEEDKEEKI